MITQPHPAFGWVLVALIAVLGVLVIVAKKDCQPADVKKATGFNMPAFAMEFAEDYNGVAALYKACKPEFLRKALKDDDCKVIPL